MARVDLGRTMAHPIVELDDIQGILRSGYGSLEDAVFLTLLVADVAKAKSWIAAAASANPAAGSANRITTVADLQAAKRDDALHIALTAPGLRALGLAEDIAATFSREFVEGMASDDAAAGGRPRRLGDLGANAPANWLWGAGADVPHGMLMLYARKGRLDALLARVRTELAGAFVISRELATSTTLAANGDRLEHFGFMDGISQPAIDWKAERAPGGGDVLEYGNLVAAGEFLLGYANEYGLYEARPLLAPERDPRRILTLAEDSPGQRDFGRNGSYLVFRHLDQDVSGFWRFVAALDPATDGAALAEAMVGRRLATGEPLAAPVGMAIQGIAASEARRNGFTFDTDADGLACPFGAHIRRANPRTADFPGGPQGLVSRLLRQLGFEHGGPREDLMSSARFHRLLRRGRAYGAFADRKTAHGVDGAATERGLHFIGLNASISRQFEFIQNAWLMNPTFNGMSGESDPLLGNRLDFPAGRPTNAFTVPQANGPCRRAIGVPQFITVRGGAYFFLPSLRALRFLAQ